MDARLQALENWLLNDCRFPYIKIHPMQGDASFRRYFRVETIDGSYVAMDAPAQGGNCEPFIAISKSLRLVGLHAPEVIALNLEQGFLLLTDFGKRVYLNELNATNAEELYKRALNALVVLQNCRRIEGHTIPMFTAEFMRSELELFKEWFLQKHLSLPLAVQDESELNACFDFLVAAADEQTKVFMHRDYHSANLMILTSDEVGILDFQDAFIGPVTYDVVSLLRDCYVEWPDEMVKKLVLYYWEKLALSGVSEQTFIRWVDLMGLQRHMKALLTFARKLHRDNDANYVRHIPRTVNYIVRVSAQYPECAALHEFMNTKVLTACAE